MYFNLLDGSTCQTATRERQLALWEEYEAGATPTAKLCKDLDKFEMLLQAREYERATGVDLSEFYQGVRGKITNPCVAGWIAEVEAGRK
jgi:putative hydrolase of HD superfamily